MSEQARGLTAEQLEMLLRSLSPNRVRQHQGQSHLEAWDVRKWLTRIFGFGGWSDEILALDMVHESIWPVTDGKGEPVPGKHRATVVYRVTLRLTVKDVHGNVIGSWDDVATGEAVNQPTVGDAHDLAIKAAVSQAIKRCAVNLGDQFGLSLYNDGATDAVVVRTLGHPGVARPVDEVEDAPVVGGELGEQDHAEQQPEAAPVDGQPAADVPMISDGQRKAVFAMLARKHGKVSDEQRYAGLSKFVGRKVASLNEYTHAEAASLLEALAKQPDHAPAAPVGQADGNANFREAEALLKLEQGQESVRLEEDLRDAIESSESYGELTAAMNMATAARDDGRLTREQYSKLAAAADQRAASGKRTAVHA